MALGEVLTETKDLNQLLIINKNAMKNQPILFADDPVLIHRCLGKMLFLCRKWVCTIILANNKLKQRCLPSEHMKNNMKIQ